MIQLLFDFNNGIGSYRDGEVSFVRQIAIFEKSAYWQVAAFAFTTEDGRRIFASWKVWKGSEQFVQLDEYDQEMYEIAKWSYTENTNDEVRGGRHGYSVIVVGCRHGDWMSI